MSGETKPRVKKDVYEKMQQFCLDNKKNSFSKGVALALLHSEKFIEVCKVFEECEDDPFEFYESVEKILEGVDKEKFRGVSYE